MAGLPGLPAPGFSQSEESTDLGNINAATGGLPGLPPPGFSATKDWNVIDSLKNLGSGAVEGTTGLFGLVADLNPMQPGGPKLSFPLSKKIKEVEKPLLATEDPQYRYARTLGQFVGPGGIASAAGKVVKGAKGGASVLGDWLISQFAPKAVIQAGGAALGAQAATDVTRDKKVAPIAGALFGGVTPSLFSSAGSAARSLFRGATPQEVKGSAAQAFGELTGLKAGDIESSIKNLPDDDLAKLMTTAEVTDNVGVAQIEKTLSASDDAARIYNTRAELREQARNAILEAGSKTRAVNKEGLGAKLLEKANAVEEVMSNGAQSLWSKVPRKANIDVSDGQSVIKDVLNQRQAGLPINSKVQNLVDQFIDTNTNVTAGRAFSRSRTSGALQDMRSDALTLLRDKELTGFERKVLTSLESEIDNSMGKGLLGEDYEIWRAAREATAVKKETFKRGTAGGALLEPTARPATILDKVFKGDSQSIKELKSAIGKDPALLEDVKRGVIDSIPRDAQGNLTANKMKSFLNANEGGLKELFGKDHYESMTRILGDLQSEAKVGQMAFRSSKGNSVTAQRGTVAGVIQDTMLGALIPGSGTLSKIADTVKKAANIRDAKGVQELLFRAAMDPKFAIELAKTPTNTRIFSALDRLSNAVEDAAKAAGTVSALELSRTEDNRMTKDFDSRTKEVAKEVGADPEHLFKVMNFETGGELSSTTKNQAGSGATGLIQFMPETAKQLTGADTKEAAIKILSSMTPTEQLDYVEKYLKPFKGKLNTLEDLYMAVLYPKAVGKDSSYALFKKGTVAYWQNRGLDLDKDGIITKMEATNKVANFEV